MTHVTDAVNCSNSDLSDGSNACYLYYIY